ncbi:MAG TPA: ATP-grasp domain-containing protein [Pyrodictium sp.]|nr:ATP-grasp domain-containing protein [Pyrodictium sp.]
MTILLIANRGEVVVRVAKTARELGWKIATIYEPDDRQSPHIRVGDIAVEVDSYTSIDSVVEAALRVGADIVHPGYGFLSENPEFAKKLLDLGISWAGPSPEKMRLLGDKIEARRLAEQAGVPVLPWCEALDVGDALRCAEDIGYPVVVKASNTGGGRGQRIARNGEELVKAFQLVALEARGWGKPRIFVEKFVENARHVEVQILADRYGSVVHLYERECSVQRRRQKIVEEAPSPLTARRKKLRSELLDYALKLSEYAGYDGIGTLEFIYDPKSDQFYFIEANTRLQVEHGVTEMVTGVDIVKHQLLTGLEKPLSLRQSEITVRGWAVEARVYAEKVLSDFAPAEGVVTKLRMPSGPWLRVDSIVEEGYHVNPKYDTLLAKIIAWGSDRLEAVKRLEIALKETVIGGVETNLDLLRELLASEEFVKADYHTLFLEKTLDRIRRKISEKLQILKEIVSRINMPQLLHMKTPNVRLQGIRWRTYGWLAASTRSRY